MCILTISDEQFTLRCQPKVLVFSYLRHQSDFHEIINPHVWMLTLTQKKYNGKHLTKIADIPMWMLGGGVIILTGFWTFMCLLTTNVHILNILWRMSVINRTLHDFHRIVHIYEQTQNYRYITMKLAYKKEILYSVWIIILLCVYKNK